VRIVGPKRFGPYQNRINRGSQFVKAMVSGRSGNRLVFTWPSRNPAIQGLSKLRDDPGHAPRDPSVETDV
jgi:hypothetical protein